MTKKGDRKFLSFHCSFLLGGFLYTDRDFSRVKLSIFKGEELLRHKTTFDLF